MMVNEFYNVGYTPAVVYVFLKSQLDTSSSHAKKENRWGTLELSIIVLGAIKHLQYLNQRISATSNVWNSRFELSCCILRKNHVNVRALDDCVVDISEIKDLKNWTVLAKKLVTLVRIMQSIRAVVHDRTSVPTGFDRTTVTTVALNVQQTGQS